MPLYRAEHKAPTGANNDALLTDAYLLSMAQAYLKHRMIGPATFELFVRRLPPNRAFLVAAGLEQVISFLENFCFTKDDLQWLRATNRYNDDLLDFLESVRFLGDVAAMPEGTIFFPNEPILRITAPLPVAQLLEARVMNLLHFQTVIASKAARMAIAARGKLLIDFGLRRAHGAEAGLLAARASYLAGFDGTSTLLAGQRFGIPTYGTMAHSFIEAHANESEAFFDFASTFPSQVTLLIDTYSTARGALRVIDLAPALRARGISVRAVRIDSGDLASEAFRVRKMLDHAGLREIGIFVSGGLNEKKIETLINGGAPIDGFGVGTSLTTASDAPSLDCAYKLQEYVGEAKRKTSPGKETLPGKKQVYRYFSHSGSFDHDILALADEAVPGANHHRQPLLLPVMRAGKRLQTELTLVHLREAFARELRRLPKELRTLNAAQGYPVRISRGLGDLTTQIDRKIA